MICGIYCIRCIPTDECYVGLSVNIEFRLKTHVTALRRGNHDTGKFQAAFNERGEENFDSMVLEECDRVHLPLREVYWMLRLRPALNHAVPDYDVIDSGKPVRPSDYVPMAKHRFARIGACVFCNIRDRCKDQRYCSDCRSHKIGEMKRAGYLQRVPKFSCPRPREARELVYETKFGIDR